MARNEFEVSTMTTGNGKREVIINGQTYFVSEDTACLVHALMCIERTIEDTAI